MTNGEKRELANVIIEELNRPTARIYAKEQGKAATVHDVILYCLDDEELLPGTRIEVNQMVKAAAYACKYPAERIPFITCKLSFDEILKQSEMTKASWQTLMGDLSCIIDVMERNEDERLDAVEAAFKALSNIVEYGEKLI